MKRPRSLFPRRRTSSQTLDTRTISGTHCPGKPSYGAATFARDSTFARLSSFELKPPAFGRPFGTVHRRWPHAMLAPVGRGSAQHTAAFGSSTYYKSSTPTYKVRSRPATLAPLRQASA